MIVRKEQIVFVLVLQILFISKIIGEIDPTPIIVTSLVHNFDLPKNHLINPFYDPDIEIIKTNRKRRSIG